MKEEINILVKPELMNRVLNELEGQRDSWAKTAQKAWEDDYSDMVLEVYINECAFFDQLIEEIIGTSRKQTRRSL